MLNRPSSSMRELALWPDTFIISSATCKRLALPAACCGLVETLRRLASGLHQTGSSPRGETAPVGEPMAPARHPAATLRPEVPLELQAERKEAEKSSPSDDATAGLEEEGAKG